MKTRKREARSEGATTTKIIFSTTLEPPYLIMSNEEVKYGKILGESEKIMPNRYRGVIFYCVQFNAVKMTETQAEVGKITC